MKLNMIGIKISPENKENLNFRLLRF